MKKQTRTRLGWVGSSLLCLGAVAGLQAGTFSTDFNASSSTNLLDFCGTEWDGVTATRTGSTVWMASGGAGPLGNTANGPVLGVPGDGYLQITMANIPDISSVPNTSFMCGGVLFKDFDAGLVVAGFTFECDLRIGNGNPNPADGFSISYIRNTDPVLLAINAGDTLPNMNNPNTIDSYGGQFSDNGNSGDLSLMEEGTQTGLSIGFDMWDSGNYAMPPTSPAVGKELPGLTHDTIGLDIRVDNVLQTTIDMPNGTTQINAANGATAATATDPTAIETGAYDGTGSASNLFWCHFKLTLDTSGVINVWWKTNQILTNFHSVYAPSPGRLLMAARVGGNTANINVDNVQITTTPSEVFIIGNATANTPTSFTQTISDSGQSVVSLSSIQMSLNGAAIPPADLTVTKDTNGTTWAVYNNPALPFAPGAVNTVLVSASDGLGHNLSRTNTFSSPAYVTLNPATAATGATGTPGFMLKIYQVDYTDALGALHASDLATTAGDCVATMERQLHGDLGPNTADLSRYTGTGGTYNEPKVINYNALTTGNIGDWPDDGSVDNTTPAPNVPGLPGAAQRESGNDDVTMQIITYIQFPAPGAYELIFSSDDGFRMTTAANPLEILNSQIVAQADQGKGAGDIVGWIYVAQAGTYPFRTIYGQGGGGCNLEWTSVNLSGAKALVNDLSTNVSLKSYAVNNGAMPAAVSFMDPPVGSGRAPTPDNPIKVDITQGANTVSGVKLVVNGTDVTSAATITAGAVTKVVYQPNPILPVNNTVVISFMDGTNTYIGTNTFTCGGGVEVPPSMALKAADVDKTKPGFLIHTYQIGPTNTSGPGPIQPGNSTIMGEYYVHQLWGWPNVASLTTFTGPGSSFVETDSINYNGGARATTNDTFLTGGNIGNFLDDGTIDGLPASPNMPGIVYNANLQDYGTDNYGLEIRTVLDLQPGFYQMGVNSDDGFRLIIGDGKEAFTFPVTAGEYNGGRGADNWGFTRFAIHITQAGLYPFRLVYYEGGGGNNVEWFQLSNPAFTTAAIAGSVTSQWLPDNDGKTLINNTVDNPNAIKAYQYPIASTGPTYVKSFAPGRSSWDTAGSIGRAGQDATVTAVLVDGSTPVTNTTVTLSINGTSVMPAVNQAGGVTTVTYKPAAGFALGSTNNVVLGFTDRTVAWTFVVGLPATPTFWIESADFDYNGGSTQAAASVMPYAGGAYAGLGAVAGTDYNGPNEGDNPYYRYPNTLKVPVSIATDFDRGGGEVVVDYRLGWMGSGHWYNYTRTFPAGTYNVYAGLSSGTAGDTVGGRLDKMVNGATNEVGVFHGKVGFGGGWGNNNLFPLKDAATTNTVLSLALSGAQTLRFNSDGGDWDYMLFAPAVSPQPQFTGITVDASGNVTLTWTGGGTLQMTTSLTSPVTWTSVTGATSPYIVTKANLPGPVVFARIKQ